MSAPAPIRPRRLLLVVAFALLVLATFAPAASAHPLGNFTTNQLVTVAISEGKANLTYTLDQAEIPTFQALQRLGVGSADQLSEEQTAQLESEIVEELGSGLQLSADGRPVPLGAPTAVEIDFPEGQGGLDLLRLDAEYQAPLPAAATSVALDNGAFDGRRGWKAVQILPGEGADVISTVPATDPTAGLTSYPQGLLESPSDVRQASFEVSPGDGQITAPEGLQGGESTTDRGSEDGFAGTLTGSDASGLAFLLLLLAAFAWGALHALSPGHGKAMVAGYLVGARGTPRHAVILGATVTITHTASVFALGAITLAASQYILPEDLYPWLSIASGLMVVGIGVTVMRSRYLRWRGMRAAALAEGSVAVEPQAHHSHDHSGATGDGEAHQHDHDHGHTHSHGDDHDHGHSHAPEGPITMRSLIALGVSGGLVPCPSALVVLIAAISQHRIGLGMVLILAFSLGLAATMTAIGLTVIWGGRAVRRFRPDRRVFGARFVGALPAISASIIVVAGVMISLRAVPELGL